MNHPGDGQSSGSYGSRVAVTTAGGTLVPPAVFLMQSIATPLASIDSGTPISASEATLVEPEESRLHTPRDQRLNAVLPAELQRVEVLTWRNNLVWIPT